MTGGMITSGGTAMGTLDLRRESVPLPQTSCTIIPPATPQVKAHTSCSSNCHMHSVMCDAEAYVHPCIYTGVKFLQSFHHIREVWDRHSTFGCMCAWVAFYLSKLGSDLQLYKSAPNLLKEQFFAEKTVHTLCNRSWLHQSFQLACFVSRAVQKIITYNCFPTQSDICPVQAMQ